MAQQVPLTADDDAGERQQDGTVAVAADVAYLRVGIVNVAFLGLPGEPDWLLIDAGLAGSAGFIRRAAERRFGTVGKPAGIILTHGHFDHVGAIESLANAWDVPVWAHRLEHPYLDGSAAYPPPDPAVGGGLIATLSPLFPRGPIDIRPRLRSLPADGSLPVMPQWRWLHTPGHCVGHVSLWREADRLLLAADAVVTTAQESAYAALTQEPEMHGPPRYFTSDWQAAGESVRRLAGLRPDVILTGHGRPMRGEAMLAALDRLAQDFESIAVPAHDRRRHASEEKTARPVT